MRKFLTSTATAAIAIIMLGGLAKPSLAGFTCDAGSLAGNCTISLPQDNVSGNTTVVGDLTITSTGELSFVEFAR